MGEKNLNRIIILYIFWTLTEIFSTALYVLVELFGKNYLEQVSFIFRNLSKFSSAGLSKLLYTCSEKHLGTKILNMNLANHRETFLDTDEMIIMTEKNNMGIHLNQTQQTARAQ